MADEINYFPTIETERLFLRQLLYEDTDFVFQYFGNPAVTQYLLDEPPITEYAQAEEIVQSYAEPVGKTHNRWILIRKSDLQPIGTVGYHKWDKRYFRAEIGYDLLPDFWGQGYMSEALQVVLSHGFERMGLNRIDALIYIENERSIHLVQKLGFKQEGLLRDFFDLAGKFYNHYIFGLLKKDFLVKTNRCNMDDETKLFYNLTAQKSADEWYENYMLMPSIEEFVALLPENPKVLDLGCGGGYESMRLTKAGAQVLGVDFSEESIRIAKERCPEANFELIDFRQLEGANLGRFDGIFACASLIHISQEELPGVFAQIHGILKGNGFVIAIVRDGEGIWEGWPEVDGQKIKRIVYLHSIDTLTVAASGFKYVKQGYLAPELIENGWRSHIFQS